ncbi:hypothetical protein P8452_59332 [Trifolium repens]|nr:hypothetical protein P8452_59332 [Trifolium repens]
MIILFSLFLVSTSFHSITCDHKVILLSIILVSTSSKYSGIPCVRKVCLYYDYSSFRISSINKLSIYSMC